MISKLHFQYIGILSFVVISLNWLLFGDLSVDFIFLFGNFIVVILSIFLINYCQINYIPLKEEIFVKKIFWFSLSLRIFSVVFYHVLFYYITGTEFDIEAIDALWYDEVAKVTSASFLDGTFSLPRFLININASFDDSGYVVFLSFLYSVFDNNIFVVRIIQAIISAQTVVLIYRVSKTIFGEKTAKLTSILLATFHLLLLFTALHLKETLMVYFLILFTYQCIKLFEKKITLYTLAILMFSLLALFSFRTVLGLTSLLSLIGYLMISGKIPLAKKGLMFLTMCGFIYFIVINFPALDEVVDKSKRYAGIETEGKALLGGSKESGFTSQGQSFAKYAGGGVFFVQSIVLPYPSMVKTNIVFYNQTLQWYFAGTLLIWAFLTYYAYVGIYYSVKNHFRQSSILLINIAVYTVALISAFYITSIRQNIIKLVLLIPFIAFGVISSNQRIRNNFIKYAIVIGIIVLVWNYIKVAGRGLL